MNIRLAIINMFSVIFAIMASYISQRVGINGNTISSLSAEYANLFTPAGYAFAIWGIIFIGLLLFGVFQIYRSYTGQPKGVRTFETGPWFYIANFANSLWVIAWLYEYALVSVLLMLLILGSLIALILKNDMERWDDPFKTIGLFLVAYLFVFRLDCSGNNSKHRGLSFQDWLGWWLSHGIAMGNSYGRCCHRD